MKTITLRGKTDSKGKLKLDVQTDTKNKDFEALLLLDSDSEEEPMPSLKIKDIPNDLYETLSALAEEKSSSIDKESLEILKIGLAKTPECLARARRAQTLREISELSLQDTDSFPDPNSLIREEREK